MLLAIPAVVGSVIGAQLAVDIDREAFEKAIAVVMLLMIFFMFFKPSQFLHGRADLLSRKVDWKQLLIFFLIGIYGGGHVSGRRWIFSFGCAGFGCGL